jgi:NADPH:quinone reductase-like Zn-dependent oxidoreductase
MARTHGAYAEYTAVALGTNAAVPIAKIPDGVTDEQAAALPIPAVTALGSLELLGTTSGQRLFVIGAIGAVGGFAVQMALSRCVYVIASVRGNVEDACRLGAEEVYDSNTVDVIGALHKSHPEGVDAVLDLVNGPAAIKRNAEVIRPGGSLVSTIFAADEAWFAEREIKAHNIAGNSNPFSTTEGLTEIAGMLTSGIITARIRSTVDLGHASEALDSLRKGGLRGKVLIRIEA